MSCCGNKRKAWQEQLAASGEQAGALITTEPDVPNHPDRIFEYTGNDSLTVHGASSGKAYTFRFKGDKANVDYTDSFALMAERDLRIVRTVGGK